MSSVYFIQAGADGPVKIGTAGAPIKRLREMQIGNHLPLALIATVAGDLVDEYQLHSRFAGSRIRGEWFSYGEELKAHVTALPGYKPPAAAKRVRRRKPEPPRIDVAAIAAEFNRLFPNYGMARQDGRRAAEVSPRSPFRAAPRGSTG